MKKSLIGVLVFGVFLVGCTSSNNVQTYKNQNATNKPRKVKDEVVHTSKKIGKGVVKITGQMWDKTKEGYQNTKEYIENR